MFKSSFLVYPLMMLVFAFIMGLMLLPMRTAMSTVDLVTVAHVGVFFSAMLVGGFAMFQNPLLERRMGGIRMMLGMPATVPVSYKEVFTYFYLKDILYYMLMNVLPVLFGIFISTLITGLHIDLLWAAATFTAAFLMGISFCFALSTILVRSRALLAVMIVAILGMIAYLSLGSGLLTVLGQLVPPTDSYMTGSPVGVLIALAAFVVFSAFSLLLIREMPPQNNEKHVKSMFPETEKKFAVFGKYAPLTAKEWTDLVRSGSLGYVLFSFILPLVFLWGLLWLLPSVLTFVMSDNHVDLQFNTVFYSVIIGFFASELYGWLNNLDSTECYKTLPISLSDVIKSKLILFCILNTVISAVYLGLICISRGEYALYPVALFTMFMVSAYVGVLTAYMTGVFTNSLLFDYKVLATYWLSVAPVLIVLIVTTFTPLLFWPGIIIAAAAGVVAFVLLGRIDKKWARAEFKQ
jgi:hypothetical protein